MAISNNIACQNIIDKLLSDYNLLFNNIVTCNEFAHKSTKYIGLIISEELSLTNLTATISEFETLETNIDLCISDIGSVDISDIDLSLFPLTPDQSLDSLLSGEYFAGSYGVVATEFIYSFNRQMKEILSTNLHYYELNATLNMVNLENCVNNILYSSVIEKINWINENSCLTSEILPDEDNIIVKLNKYGLDGDLLVDYTQQIFASLSMSDEIKTHFTTLLDLQQNINEKLTTLSTQYL